VSTLRSRLSVGTAYTLASLLIVQIISLVTSVIYARLLGLENLGLLAIINQLAAAVVPMASLGLGTAVTKLIPNYQQEGPEALNRLLSTALGIMLIAGCVVSAAFFLTASGLADLYGVPQLALLLHLSALLVVFDALLTFGVAVVQGFQRVKELAVIGLYAKAVTLPVIFAMTLAWGLLGAVLAGIISLALSLAIYYRSVRRIVASDRIRVSARYFDRRMAARILRMAIPLFAAFIVLRPALLFQASYLALAVGFAELGLFRVAYSLYRIVLFLPAALSVPLLPAISELYQAQPKSQTKTQLSSLIRISSLIILPVTLALGLASGPIIEFLYGPEYVAATSLVFVLSIAAFVDTIGSIAENAFLGTGRSVQVLILTVMQAGVITAGSYVFISVLGLIGIGYAILLNSILYVVVVGAYFHRRGEMDLRAIGPSAMLAGATFAVAAAFVVFGGLNNIGMSAVFLAVLLIVEVRLLTHRDRRILKDALKSVLTRAEP